VSRRSVSILSPDYAGNALGRAYLLAKLLQEDFDVHIVAFGEGDDVWVPVRNDPSIEYRRFFHQSLAAFWLNAPRTIRRLITGDLVYAVKPLQPSFGLGLYARRILGRPLMLDIDDWEIGFLSNSVYWEARLHQLGWLASPQSPLYTRLLDRFTRSADAITVSNSFLQNRYGGTWVPHARDERVFEPATTSNGGAARSGKLVLFLGTARHNKGLDTLISAWSRVRDPDAHLRIIGTAPDSLLVRPLRALADDRVSFEGPVPFETIPALLASAGVIVIPQLRMRGSVGQLPAKLIDAMAVGRPIISTSVGDIPQWLADRAGVIVPPNEAGALADAITALLADPNRAATLGRRARDRFERYGSFSAVRPRLVRLAAAMIAGRPTPPPEPAFAGEALLDITQNIPAREVMLEPCASFT